MGLLAILALLLSTTSAQAEIRSAHDVVTANLGRSIGEFRESGLPCTLDITRDPHFNIKNEPYYPMEYNIRFSRPAGHSVIGICSPELDLSRERWSFDEEASTVEYRDPLEAQNHVVFHFAPTSGRILAIDLPWNGDVCLIESNSLVEPQK